MRRFLLGFIAAVVIVLLAEFLWVRLGFVDPRADVPESVLERRVAMPSLDASLDRHASEARNPIAATDDSGMPGWKSSLSEQEIWQVTTFLSHMDKLSPELSEQWKAIASKAP